MTSRIVSYDMTSLGTRLTAPMRCACAQRGEQRFVDSAKKTEVAQLPFCAGRGRGSARLSCIDVNIRCARRIGRRRTCRRNPEVHDDMYVGNQATALFHGSLIENHPCSNLHSCRRKRPRTASERSQCNTA